MACQQSKLPFWPPDQATKTILTIHDLNFLREKNSPRIAKYLRRIQGLVTQASAITTISELVRTEVEQRLNLGGKSVAVIYNGGAGLRAAPIKPAKIRGETPFLFTIGEHLEKKNFARLLPMLQYLPDFKLVIAGNNATPYGDFIRDEIVKLGLQTRVTRRVDLSITET